MSEPTKESLLELPSTVACMVLAPDMLLFKNVVPWGKDLIETANKLDLWKQSTQVGSTSGPYVSERRTSSNTAVSVALHPDLAPFERGLVNAFHSCVRGYYQYNSCLDVTDDTGYEMLRYETGQQFDTHVDAVSGRVEGHRILTGLLYLNDDYTGGETTFPRQCVKVKPEAGDIVFFPSNFCYPHASPPITSGTKFVVVTWFVAYPKK